MLSEKETGLHIQLTGEIIDIKADAEVIDEDGRPDIDKIEPLIYDSSHQGTHLLYHT